ncbi:MAG: S9 family peptidase [Myxococcota bacterium]
MKLTPFLRGLPALLCLVASACGSTPETKATPDPVSKPTPTPTTPEPAAAVGHPSNDLIPRKTFFGNPERTNVTMSPDGKFLAWLAPSDGVLNLWVAPRKDLTQAKAVTADHTRPVRTYRWAFDGTHVLYMQDAGGDENFHLHRVDVVAGGDVDLTPLEKTRAELFAASSKKPGVVLVGLNDRDPKYHDVYSIDLASGARTKVLENTKYAGFVIDEDLNVRLAVEMKDDGSSLVSDLAPAKGKKPFLLEIPPEDSLTTDPSGFDASGKTLHLIDSRKRDTGALFEVDMATGKARLAAEDPHADVAELLMHPTKATVQAVRFDYDKPRWQVLDKSLQGDFDALAKVAPGAFSVVSRTLDDRTWVVVFRSDVQPAAYYTWERRAKKATFLFSARPELDKLKLAHMNPVVIKSRDGLDLVSYLTLPLAADPDGDGKANSPGPLVLLVHGGPWARDGWSYSGLVQMLANRGYAVLQVNYRGSTGFGKSFVNAGNLQWGKKMHDDLLDAVNWAVLQQIAPRDQIAIMGGSYGGYATLAGLTLTPDVFACGVDIVGPSNLLTLLATIPPYWAPAIAQFRTRMGDWQTEDGKAALTAVSPLTHVAAIKRPLLIGQGANDPRVNKAESDQIVSAMKARGIPVSYVLFPDEGHGFARPENSLAFFAVAESFLSAHLGGTYQPMTKDDFAGSSIQVLEGKSQIPGLPSL